MRVCDAYHDPVLASETVEGLNVSPSGVYVDLTFGGGGHSRGILARLGARGRLLGFDQDEEALRQAPTDVRFTAVHANFRHLSHWLRYYGLSHVDGIVADLGVSSHHLDTPQRGFTFRADAPLDMRMNQRARLTAFEVVNTYSEERLAQVLHLYGELPQSLRIAKAMAEARGQGGIATTRQLAELLAPMMGGARQKKDMARVFQALRIEVNGEMQALGQMLASATRALRPGGRFVVLTYHSLEDRMVKNVMRTGNAEGKPRQDAFGNTLSPLRQIGKHTTPSAEETERNPRARSAKLRVAERQQNID